MSEGRWHPPRCRICGKGRADGVYVTARGLCRKHAEARYSANMADLKGGHGPFAQWWAARLAVGVGLYPLDQLPPRP